ncbi:hypothetical protein ACWAU3_04935 [Shewanella sp. JL219SE-S6]
MSQHTIPCETLTDWIEIDFRDESNQPLSGLTATVTDAAGNSRQLKLTGAATDHLLGAGGGDADF